MKRQTYLIVLEDKIYRVSESIYQKLNSLRDEMDKSDGELWKLCDEIQDGKKGKFVGHIQFHWQR